LKAGNEKQPGPVRVGVGKAAVAAGETFDPSPANIDARTTTFTLGDGLSWKSGERIRTEADLDAWIGKRGQAGRIAPRGFSRVNRFD